MVQQFREKVPVFEAMRWTDNPDEMLAMSEWLSANRWPWLDGEQRTAEPSPERQQGHWIEPENNELVILWPEDTNIVPVGTWVVKNRRYDQLDFLTEESFHYTYETYGTNG